MITAEFPNRGLVFWQVGTGDSTTVVIDDRHVLQIDLHDMAMADEDDAVVVPVVERLVEALPQRDGMPYLAAFVLTHADKDHCLGFADLLRRVIIGEIWATPRLWREYTDHDVELCADAKAFHEEVLRRVDETLEAVERGEEPASGDRVRVVGYDTDQTTFSYHDLPDEYLSRPGDAVAIIDGEDLADHFEAFIHAPFKDDCAEERNDTSLALQITIKDAEMEGHALLFGDLAYETIKKVFEYSEASDRPERLAWHALLAPHHCSKKVMYVNEDGKDVLQTDILELLEKHASENAVVIVSSGEFPEANKPGDNPPHLVALARYEEIASDVLCTATYPNAAAPQPIVFGLGAGGLELLELEEVVKSESKALGGSALVGGAAILGLIAATRAIRRRREGGQPRPRGLGNIGDAVTTVRGTDAAPRQAVGFGGV